MLRLAPDPLPARRDGAALPDRAVALAFAIAINLLLLFALLTLNAPAPAPQFKGAPTRVTLLPDADESAAAAETSQVAEETAPADIAAAPEEVAKAPAEPAPAPPRPVPVEPPPAADTRPLPFIVLTREEMAAADIGRIAPSGAAAPRTGERPAASASRSGRDSEQVGTAPDGEPLYAAEWHRRPTSTQLSAYLPARMPPEGWGLVACKTAPNYRVEDCVELADSPPGSQLAGAVRQAAWQFLVRPPRVGGKVLVGSWVRIRIDYNRNADN